MVYLRLQNLSLNYPVFGAKSFSFKNGLLHLATGGKLVKDWKVLEVQALQNITLNLEKGDRLALIGHNGAGKSTLLKVLAKIYPPTSGIIQSEGVIHSLFDLVMGMDYDCNGYENIKLKSLISGLANNQINEIVKDVEEFTELGDFMKMPIKTYSSGMLIRLGFGIVTAIHSDILLIDEVIGVGDQQFMVKANQRMKERIQNSEILVLSSHDLATVRRFCNKALWLEHGQIKAIGSTEEVLSQYEAKI